jgi:hypothetical protein
MSPSIFTTRGGCLPQPVREQRHTHRMCQGLLFLVCEKRTVIGDVAKRLFLAFLVAAAKLVSGCERRPARADELRRHSAVGCVHDDAL